MHKRTSLPTVAFRAHSVAFSPRAAVSCFDASKGTDVAGSRRRRGGAGEAAPARRRRSAEGGSPRAESNRLTSRLQRAPFPNSVQRRAPARGAQGRPDVSQCPRPDSNGRLPPSQSGVLNPLNYEDLCIEQIPGDRLEPPLRGSKPRVLPLRHPGAGHSQGRGRTSINLLGLYVQSVGCCHYTTCEQVVEPAGVEAAGVEPATDLLRESLAPSGTCAPSCAKGAARSTLT
jgi:hypothetical protein